MTAFHVLVIYADGNDFTKSYVSHVSVLADSPLDAKLVAEQLAYTPHLGKPDHIQILGSEVTDA